MAGGRKRQMGIIHYWVNCDETVEVQVEDQRMGLAIGMEKEGE